MESTTEESATKVLVGVPPGHVKVDGIMHDASALSQLIELHTLHLEGLKTLAHQSVPAEEVALAGLAAAGWRIAALAGAGRWERAFQRVAAGDNLNAARVSRPTAARVSTQRVWPEDKSHLGSSVKAHSGGNNGAASRSASRPPSTRRGGTLKSNSIPTTCSVVECGCVMSRREQMCTPVSGCFRHARPISHAQSPR